MLPIILTESPFSPILIVAPPLVLIASPRLEPSIVDASTYRGPSILIIAPECATIASACVATPDFAIIKVPSVDEILSVLEDVRHVF